MLEKVTDTLEPILIKMYRALTDPPSPNLRGDRYIEFSWIAANMPEGPGVGLEFGCAHSHLAMIAVMRGFTMTAIDLTPVHWLYTHPHLSFIKTDLFDFEVDSGTLDVVINCSAIEHVGLDRYGGRVRPDGDLEAMRRLRASLKPTGVMLLTIPVGRDAIFSPLHRVYGELRLPKLLEGYSIEREQYWIKKEDNRWTEVKKEAALQWESRRTCYGLGCLVLRAV